MTEFNLRFTRIKLQKTKLILVADYYRVLVKCYN